jgi:hypothetical protein
MSTARPVSGGAPPPPAGVSPALPDAGAAGEGPGLAPGTLVVTASGLVPVEAVLRGDRVLTHAGRFRAVTRTLANPHQGGAVRLLGKGLEPVWSAPGQLWLAACRKDTRGHRTGRTGGPRWVRADALRARLRRQGNWSRGPYHALLVPAVRPAAARIDLLPYRPDALEEGEGLRLKGSRCRPVPRSLALGRALGRLVGLYLAEGSGNRKDLRWYFHLDERELAAEVQELLRAVFGARSSNRELPRVTSRVVQTSNGILAAFFRSLGKRAPYKHMPEWALAAPPEFREALLTGLTDGDGCYRADGSTTLTTSSRSLAEGARLLLWTRGQHASLSRRAQRESSIRGMRLAGGRVVYQLSWRRPVAGTAVRFAEGRAEFFLKEATPVPYDGPVYGLEVEEDASYVTVGGAAHGGGAGPPPAG